MRPTDNRLIGLNSIILIRGFESRPLRFYLTPAIEPGFSIYCMQKASSMIPEAFVAFRGNRWLIGTNRKASDRS